MLPPPTFSMVHLLHRLYGVDAPAFIFGYSHPNYYDTTGIYHNTCLPGFVQICWTVLEKSHRKGFLWPAQTHLTFTFDFLTPKVDHFRPLPRYHLYQSKSKSVHSILKYRVDKFGNMRIKRTNWSKYLALVRSSSTEMAWRDKLK